MKKALWIGLLIVLLSVCVTVQAKGPINTSINEALTPEGADGILKVTWVGQPDDQGNVYLPVPPGKAAWKSTEVKGGTLKADKPAEVTQAGAKLYSWQAIPTATDMTMTVTYTLPNFFLVKGVQVDPDGALTQRGDIRTFKYAFDNKLPTVIGNYAFSVNLPTGNEVFRVIAPKSYTISTKAETVKVSAALKGKEGSPALVPGKSSNVEFEYVQAGSGKTGLWIVIAALSAVFLIYRRAILNSAGGEK